MGPALEHPRGAGLQRQGAALHVHRIFRIGFLTNVLNSKSMIFIVSLFMQVVQVDTPLSTRIGYGLFISLAHIVWFSATGLFFGAQRIQKAIFGVRHWIDRAFGALLIGFGIALAAANIGS